MALVHFIPCSCLLVLPSCVVVSAMILGSIFILYVITGNEYILPRNEKQNSQLSKGSNKDTCERPT